MIPSEFKIKIKIEHVNKSNQSITSIRMDYLKPSQPKSHTILHFSILFITRESYLFTP